MLISSYIHNIDPFLIEFGGGFGIRWYGLAYLAGFICAWYFFKWLSNTQRTPLNLDQVGDLVFWSVLGVMLGARLGYVFFYEPQLLWHIESSLPFWGPLAVHRGGMSAHGGMIGVIVSFLLFSKKHKCSPFHLFDLAAVAVTPGLFFGRIANFINAELWGRPLSPGLQVDRPWWSVCYPTEILQKWLPSGDNRLSQLDLLRLGDSSLTSYQTIVQMVQDGNEKICSTVEPLLTPYWPSQLIQALTDGPMLLGLLILVWIKPRRGGVVGCCFLIFYGLFRFLTEFVRQPDEGVALFFGFSRGQQLSFLMIICGIAFLVFVQKTQKSFFGGLIKKIPN